MKNIAWILLFGVLEGKVLIGKLVRVFFVKVIFLARRLKEWILSFSVLDLINEIDRFFPEHGKGVASLLRMLIFSYFVKIDQIIRVFIGSLISQIGLSQPIFILILELKNTFIVLVNVVDRLFELNQFFDDSS